MFLVLSFSLEPLTDSHNKWYFSYLGASHGCLTARTTSTLTSLYSSGHNHVTFFKNEKVLGLNLFRCPYAAAAAAKSHQACPTLCYPHRWQPTRFLCPWDSPGKNTGVGCHFLLQCMKVKSESEVAESCLTLRDPMDCSLPGSSIQGISQARVLEWGAIAFSVSCPYASSR